MDAKIALVLLSEGLQECLNGAELTVGCHDVQIDDWLGHRARNRCTPGMVDPRHVPLKFR